MIIPDRISHDATELTLNRIVKNVAILGSLVSEQKPPASTTTRRSTRLIACRLYTLM